MPDPGPLHQFAELLRLDPGPSRLGLRALGFGLPAAARIDAARVGDLGGHLTHSGAPPFGPPLWRIAPGILGVEHQNKLIEHAFDHTPVH